MAVKTDGLTGALARGVPFLMDFIWNMDRGYWGTNDCLLRQVKVGVDRRLFKVTGDDLES